jgi:hypothetical protein
MVAQAGEQKEAAPGSLLWTSLSMVARDTEIHSGRVGWCHGFRAFSLVLFGNRFGPLEMD